MKKILFCMLLAISSIGAFAQEVFISSTMITLSPTLLTLGVFGDNDNAQSSGLSVLSVSASIYDAVDGKGVNVKNQLREEGSIVADQLMNGQRVSLKKFKTLAAMIDELKLNETTKLEIELAAIRAQVSFEVMAIKSILMTTEI